MENNNAILNRIQSILGADDIAQKMASLPAKDLNSLLAHVFEIRSKNWSIVNLFEQYLESRFVGIGSVSQKKLVAFDALAYSLLPQDFESVEFATVVPFGTNSVLASTNQKNIMTTIRNLEVIADPTTTLALECAKRRKNNAGSGNYLHLATSQRCIRLQNFEEIPGFIPHFKIFALTSAGNCINQYEFEIEMLCKHLSFYLNLISTLAESNEFEVKKVSILLSDIGIAEYLINRHKLDRSKIGLTTQAHDFSLFRQIGVDSPPTLSRLEDRDAGFFQTIGIEIYIDRLRKLQKRVEELIKPHYPAINFAYDLERISGIGYYENFCLKIMLENGQGQTFPLVDGGSVPWLKKILSSKKEKFFTSGIGSELFCQKFSS